jgi:hypothetical protein
VGVRFWGAKPAGKLELVVVVFALTCLCFVVVSTDVDMDSYSRRLL